MNSRRRPAPAGLAAAGLAAALAVPAVACVAGRGYQMLATSRDARRYPGSGRLVDAGGHRLMVRITGEDLPGPPVLFENGMTYPMETWAWVQEAVAARAPTICYDRAGMGLSERGPKPRTAAAATAELRRVLANTGMAGPYVLVGHSFGGLLIRHFAHQHPGDVAGMVLVDSAHPDQLRRSIRQRLGLVTLRERMTATERRSVFGLLRRTMRDEDVWVATLPPADRAIVRSRLLRTQTWRASNVEIDGWLEHVNAEVRDTRVPPGCPLAVLTAEDTATADPVHFGLQAELAGLSGNSFHQVIESAGHINLITDNAYAGRVTAAITAALAAARTGQPVQHQRGFCGAAEAPGTQ